MIIRENHVLLSYQNEVTHHVFCMLQYNVGILCMYEQYIRILCIYVVALVLVLALV